MVFLVRAERTHVRKTNLPLEVDCRHRLRQLGAWSPAWQKEDSMTGFQFRAPGTIVAQAGSSLLIADDFALRFARKILIVSDQTLVGLGMVERIEKALRLKGADVVVFADVEPEPSAETVRRATALGSEHRVDGVVGLGGGSPMDVAKLVALLVATPQPLEGLYGVDRAQGVRLPLVLIPTTAGTGSEATRVSVITSDAHDKAPILAPQLVCDTVILDAELTLGLPPKVTAATGVDAMVHAIESYTSGVRKNPVSDRLALQALALLFDNIRRAVTHGGDIDARSSMLTGSMLAGLAFANASVGAVHAIAYPLGPQFHVSHGGSNAVVLVPVMRFNMPEATTLYAQIARVVLPGIASGDDHAAADRLVHELETLIPEVGLENRLSPFGIRESHLSDLIEGALRQQRILSYNIKVPGRDDIEAVFRAVL
jgi:alcohol dehydrogenase class IV